MRFPPTVRPAAASQIDSLVRALMLSLFEPSTFHYQAFPDFALPDPLA